MALAGAWAGPAALAEGGREPDFAAPLSAPCCPPPPPPLLTPVGRMGLAAPFCSAPDAEVAAADRAAAAGAPGRLKLPRITAPGAAQPASVATTAIVNSRWQVRSESMSERVPRGAIRRSAGDPLSYFGPRRLRL